jgi:hypothetical protein
LNLTTFASASLKQITGIWLHADQETLAEQEKKGKRKEKVKKKKWYDGISGLGPRRKNSE